MRVGNGVSKEYFFHEDELFPVCPDCLWGWVQFLSTNPTKTFAPHESEAIAVMWANASSSSRMYGSPNAFLKHFIQNNRVSKRHLIYVLQRHPVGSRFGSGTSAADKIKELSMFGSIEIMDNKCYWNDNPTSRLLPDA